MAFDENWDEIIPKCERTDKHGYCISFNDGTKIMMEDWEMAKCIYAGADNAVMLSVYDGGYVIPLFSK